MSEPTMQAVRIHDYGGLEALEFEEAPRPQPQANQILVRVKAAGVNPADGAMRSGAFRQFMPLQLPWTPGLEGAGVVEAVGAEVSSFRPGQEVYGFLIGGYAQYALANPKEIQPKPAILTMEEAGSVPMGALMAWGAVVETAQVAEGQSVLILGAAGGIGSYATQLAHWKGAYVMGTTSAQNLAFVRSLGAQLAIDYAEAPFESVVKAVDVVIDTVGGDMLDRSFAVLQPGGIFVTVAGRLQPDAGKAQGVRALGAGRPNSEKLETISELLQSKTIVPTIRAVFPLAEARKAQELSETRHGRGRIVLSIP
jgi:NADPH:quinone reductase-like Zn-dependent oxidoreductase